MSLTKKKRKSFTWFLHEIIQFVYVHVSQVPILMQIRIDCNNTKKQKKKRKKDNIKNMADYYN